MSLPFREITDLLRKTARAVRLYSALSAAADVSTPHLAAELVAG
jgi:hypothetical protein